MIASLQESPFYIETPVPRYQATFELDAGNLRDEMTRAAEEFLASSQYVELDTGREILGFEFGLVFATPSGGFQFEPYKDRLKETSQDSASAFYDYKIGDELLGIKHSSKWEQSLFFSAKSEMLSVKTCQVISASMTFGDNEIAVFDLRG